MFQPFDFISYAGRSDIFVGTVRENVDLGRDGIGQARVRAALEAVGLSEVILRLSNGLQTQLQTGGYPLTEEQVARLMIARAIVSNPKLLVLNGTLDHISPANLEPICKKLLAEDASWTLAVMTDQPEIAARFGQQINIRRSEHTVRNGGAS